MNKDRGCKKTMDSVSLPGAGGSTFQRFAWFKGCELRRSNLAACKAACTNGCCDSSTTREDIRCSSSSCVDKSSGCCADAEAICKLACERYFNPIPIYAAALQKAVDVNDGVCISCPAGTYQPNSNVQATCKKMDVCNTLNAYGCTNACGLGQGLISPSASGGTGAVNNDGTCSTCDAGYFSSTSDASSCIKMGTSSCPRGQGYSSASSTAPGNSGSTSNDGQCNACPSGRNQILADSTETCATCPAGSASANAETQCVTCDTGTYQEKSPATEYNCKVCGAGSEFVDNTTPCKYCNRGFEYVESTRNCSKCPTGKVQPSDSTPSVVCVWCAAGKGYVQADIACSTCASGKYQNTNDGSGLRRRLQNSRDVRNDERRQRLLSSDNVQTCKTCQAGKQFVSITNECSTCSAGSYHDSNTEVAAVCKACPNGRYLLDTASDPSLHTDVSQCLFCVAGKRSRSISQSCEDCTLGQYQNSNSTAPAICQSCGKGKFAPSKIAECEDCHLGKYSTQNANTNYDCKFCSQGKEFVSGAESCAECAYGKFQPSSSSYSPECKLCVPGKYQPSAGQDDCRTMSVSSCNPGYRFDSPSATNQTGLTGSVNNDGYCTICAPGFWKGTNNPNERCVTMTEPAGKNKCPANEGFSSASAQTLMLTGSSSNDGVCTQCNRADHEYSAFDDASACYLYTCQVDGNRCAAGYKCCEKNGQRCIPNNKNCVDVNTGQDQGASDAACNTAAGYKRCESAGNKCLKTDGSEPCLCAAGTFKAPEQLNACL